MSLLDTDNSENANPYRAPEWTLTPESPAEPTGAKESLLKQTIIALCLVAIFPLCVIAFFVGLGLSFLALGLSSINPILAWETGGIIGLVFSILTWIASLKLLNRFIGSTPHETPKQLQALQHTANSSGVHKQHKGH